MAYRTHGEMTLRWLLLLSGVLLSCQAAPTDVASQAETADRTEPIAEARSQKQDEDVLDMEEDLDGRSAYVNNQFVPSEPVELLDDEQNAPLYEILQKQMEQVLAASGPDLPIFEEDKKRQRTQQPPNKPLFTSSPPADVDDDYEDETLPEPSNGYGDAEKPDAATGEEPPESGYQAPQVDITQPLTTTQPPSSTTTTTTTTSTTVRSRPQRRRSTTALPRSTRAKASSQSKLTSTTHSPTNQTEVTSTTAAPLHKQTTRAQAKPSSLASNLLPHDPQIYQHKRRIIFKTISTGSQFVNSPIGDLMIKFSIGFAKPAPSMAAPSNEALRALSQNLWRNIELQKLKRNNKVQRD